MGLIKVDLRKKLAPITWLLDGLLLHGYLNFLASLPGQGKTALLTGLAWQMSRPGGGDFLGRTVAPGHSIYLDYDAPGDGRSIRFWLEKHKAAHPDGDASQINLLEPDADTFGLNEADLGRLVDIVKETRAAMVIVDSFMAAFPATDPVKLTAVQGPLWVLRKLAAETGAAVVLVDHLPKPMNGEVAGARGVMGSVAKPAQSRAVHVLTRVPPGEVEGRNVLRWDVQKMSYAKLPEPFGVELRFSGDAVYIENAALPQTTTRTQKAVHAMQSHLEEQRGQVVERKTLLDIAIKTGNLRERAGKTALSGVLAVMGDALETVSLPGKGGPVGYRLKPEDDDPPHYIGMTAPNAENTVQDGETFGSPLFAPKEKTALKETKKPGSTNTVQDGAREWEDEV